MNFQVFKLDLEKAEEPEIKLPTSTGSSKKQESSRKTSTSALLTMPKPLTVWITTNYGKLLKRGEYQTILPASWEICTQVKKQQLELCMEQLTGSGLRKEYDKPVYCHPVYLTYKQSTSCEMPDWIELQARIKIAGRNIKNLRYADDTALMAESEEEIKNLLRVKEESEKASLRLNIKKTKIMESSPITSWQVEGEKVKAVTDFISLGSKSPWTVTAAWN